jgi:hypothetical protein
VLHGPNGTEQGTSHVRPWLKSPEEITTQCATWNQWYRTGRNHVPPWLKNPEDIEHNVLHGTKSAERERTTCCLVLRIQKIKNTMCYMEPMVQNGKEPCAALAEESRRYRTQCATWNQECRTGKNHVMPCLKNSENIEHNVLHGTKGIEWERTMCCLG